MSVRTDAEPTLLERLGGRWAISLRSYWVLCIGILLALFATEAGATASLRGAVLWLAIAVIAMAALGSYLLILDRWTPYAHRRERPIPLPVLVFGTAGAGIVLGLVISGAAVLLGLETTTDVVRRTFGYIVIGEWLGLALILLFDGIDRSRRRRTALMERQVSMELASLQQTLLIDELRKQAVKEVSLELTTANEDVRRRLDALSDAPMSVGEEDVADMLRSVASGEVRTLSARLWDTATRAYPKVPWWTVIVSTLRREPLRPLALVTIHVLGNFSALTATFGISVGLAMLAVVSLEVVVVSFVANRLMRRYPQWHVLLFIAGALCLQAYVIPMALWRDSLVAGSGSVQWMLSQFLAGLVVIVMTSAFGSWRHVLGSLERAYAVQLDEEQVQAIARSRAVADVARELSRELHGAVQSKLVACAMVSERAVESGDMEELEATLLEAQRVLTGSLATLEQPRTEVGVAEEVRRKAALWDELCTISLRIDPDLDSDAAGELAGRVVEEALSNAIRHGGATTISIAVERAEPDGVRIVVEDDGTGPPAEVAPGLGSSVLDQATRGRWSLTALPRGTRLEAIVSPRPADGVV